MCYFDSIPFFNPKERRNIRRRRERDARSFALRKKGRRRRDDERSPTESSARITFECTRQHLLSLISFLPASLCFSVLHSTADRANMVRRFRSPLC